MESRTRRSIASGTLLILLGLLFLVYQFMPDRFSWLQINMGWPLIIIAVGVFMLIFGLIVGAPGMAVPASILAGIGGLLYWQIATGQWDTWSYAWALIPGFVGVGVILTALLGGGKLRESIEGGGTLILISLVMFAIFGSFLGGLQLFGNYWPVLLILLGVIMLARSFFPRK
ncbi:MAG: hypothetical protein IH586_00835 [Anaerolineaceae bacterium]|nr:hypothetical protein [Anaerolineaceae bacterium]